MTAWKGKRKPVTLVPAAMIRNMSFRRGVLAKKPETQEQRRPEAHKA
jgi:hypothetical protein